MNPFQVFGINTVPSKYTFSLPCRLSNQQEKRCVLATHINWVRELVSSKRIPSSFPIHENLQEDEIQAFLSQGKSTPLGSQWMFLLLTVIKTPKRVETFRSMDSVGQQQTRGSLTWPQIIDFIGESNFNFIWEQPRISLLPNNDNIEGNVGPTSSAEASGYMNKLLKSIYINLDDSSCQDGNVGPERFPISNLSQALSIVVIPSQSVGSNGVVEDFDSFLVFHQYMSYSLHDAVTFSPHKVASTTRQLFIIYQMLQFLRDFHTLGLPLGELSLSDFKIDECLYLNVIPWMSDILEKLKCANEPIISKKGDPIVISKVKNIVKKVKGWSHYSDECAEDGQTLTKLEPKLVESVIRHWCEGLITNYEYLMFLNYLCGRFCNGNPNFHPVFPWVSDFSHPQGGWRDLTKSKFRLNKGERQLDIMYEEVGGSNERTIAHHVTDILSEITFYVYKARKTPKEVLCKFVRPKWVPAEYPASISRMQEWTPDECIPEFFDDPSIFKSMHDDLADLQVPKWCSSPEEFIKQHRKLLESDYVSAKLHHWIDLTFGYKLSGTAAVKSKNIYLSLVDSHQYLESHGIVQLFQSAHPPKKNVLRDARNTVQYKDLKKLRDQEIEEPIILESTNIIDPKTKMWKNINLPKHYDPMGLFNDFEVTMNFFRTHFPYLKDPNVILTGIKSRQQIPRVIKLFGCLLVELVIPQKVRHISCSMNMEDKFDLYKAVLKGSMTHVPLFCRRAVQTIFDRDCLEFAIPIEMSLDLLLMGDRLGPIPFPLYFEDVYKMLRTMRNYEKVLATASPEDFGYKLRLQELKVQSFSRDLLQLINTVLDNEGVDLVMPFVVEMFENPETRILAVWNLFCPFAKTIGRKSKSKLATKTKTYLREIGKM